jgi:hypothetical protein
MCAASPRLIAFASSECGPLVGLLHSGLEQTCPALFANVCFVPSEKSGPLAISLPFHFFTLNGAVAERKAHWAACAHADPVQSLVIRF